MPEPLDLLGPAPRERVLWQGRAAVGAAWPSFRRLGLAGLALLPVAGLALGTGRTELLLGVAALGLALAVVAASKVLGPSYLLIAWVLVAAPLCSAGWVAELARQGWQAGGRAAGFMFVAATFLGLPLGFLVLEVTDRLTTWLVITTTRVAAVRLGGPVGVLWEQRLDAASPLRVERTWRAPEGCLVAGWRRLRLRDDDPREVVQLVRSARDERRP